MIDGVVTAAGISSTLRGPEQREVFPYNGRRRERGDLRNVIGRRDLDHIHARERHATQPAQDCLRLPCAWNCRWERNPTWHNGITIPYAVCDRRWSSCICPSSRWVALTPWCTGCKPRLQNRRLLRAGLHLSGRGAANLSLFGRPLLSGAGPGRSPNPASDQSMKPTALIELA